MEKAPKKAVKGINGRFEGYFYSKSFFNLNIKVLAEIEIYVLEENLEFAPTPTKISEIDLRSNFDKLVRKMRYK